MERNSPTAGSNTRECFHCGTPCPADAFCANEKSFCCHGCLTVFEILNENGLTDFYTLAQNAGVRVAASRNDQFTFLDAPTVREKIVNFSNEKLTRVTFRIPTIHCIACVWLLENLFRLKPGIGSSQVNFPRKEVLVSFETEKIKLSEVVTLLASLGYAPDLNFADLESKKTPVSRRLWLQLGIAGFAFGNIMLFSISSYLGFDVAQFKKLFGYLSFALALPVMFYSAADYWKASWRSLQRKRLTIDVPIAAGILAIFLQSVYEIFSGHGDGYFDSLSGLLFFLLCGKLFQQKTFDRLAFDRDYKSFFPLSVTRVSGSREEAISISELQVGDQLRIRNGELIPADAQLLKGDALIDYSFVTGESEPVAKTSGGHLYAGGRQIGGAIEGKILKAVSQSYLTSLWNQDALRKEKTGTFHALIDLYSERFTRIIFAIAFGAAIFWAFKNPALSAKAFSSVLIVACPCALALASPFALGTAQRVLARRNIFLKNADVLETLAKVDSVIFDKTGTLTAAGAGSISFEGAPLSDDEKTLLAAIAQNSTHPLSLQIAQSLGASRKTVRAFSEIPGCGVEGFVDGKNVVMGSPAWVANRADFPRETNLVASGGSVVCVAIDGTLRGQFVLTSAVRPQTETMLRALGEKCELALLSGDNERERAIFSNLFGDNAQLKFNQSPQQKFEFVDELHRRNKIVMMVGDGLNDAGALKNADVGVAVVESISAFSPASDIIMSAQMVPRLADILRFSRNTARVVKMSFLISSVYNVIGISIAASGKLAPVVCAILMPLSSITVVAFACGMTTWISKNFVRSSRGDEAHSSQSQIKNQKSQIDQSLLTSALTRFKEAA